MSSNELVHFINLIAEPVLIVDGEGAIVLANAATGLAIGKNHKTLIGQRLPELVVDPPDKLVSSLRYCSRSKEPILGAFTLRKHNGTEFRFPYRGMLLHPRTDDSPALIGFQLERSSQFLVLDEKICQFNVIIRQLIRS